jgi:hypothetical protein
MSMSTDEKYTYEEDEVGATAARGYGVGNIILGIAMIIGGLVSIPVFPYVTIISVPMGIIFIWYGANVAEARRFLITEDYVQFPQKIDGHDGFRRDAVARSQLIVNENPTGRKENIRIELKDGKTIIVRIGADMYVDDFLKLKKALDPKQVN